MAKSISAFEGSNEVRHLNKSSVNVASGSKETSVDATKTFARTVPFSANDIGYVTVDPSLMTAEKSGVTYDITKSLENGIALENHTGSEIDRIKMLIKL